MTTKQLKDHKCDPKKSRSLRDSRGIALATVCNECVDAVTDTFPARLFHRRLQVSRGTFSYTFAGL
jgi:hypothetical protein